MDARELRIDNILSYNGRIISFDRINSITNTINDPYNEWQSGIDICDLEGIPLKEKRLLEFGFVETTEQEDESKSFEKEFGRKSIRIVKLQPDLWQVIFRIDYGMNYHEICDIEFVHQIQNLIFALTREELKLKDETQ